MTSTPPQIPTPPLSDFGATPEDSLTDALENALANLKAASPSDIDGARSALSGAYPEQQDAQVPPEHGSCLSAPMTPALGDVYASSTLALVKSVCGAPNRMVATEKLAHAICPVGSSGNVRIGVGRKRLEKLYDLRLGWLGTDSSIFDKVRQEWQQEGRLDQEVAGDDAAGTEAAGADADSDTDTARIVLRHPSGAHHQCQIWIDNDRAAATWIGAAQDMVASAYWSRPAKALPSWIGGLNRPSKMTLTSIPVFLGIVMLWPVPYRIDCLATVETVGQRYVATPFTATLDEVLVRPGDHVTEGQTLLRFDGRPLRLERESLRAELQEAEKEQIVAMATHEIADAQQLSLKCQKFRRQIELIDDQLDQVNVVSPMDGIVISGDLQKNIGSPIPQGENLMEIAPMEEMVIEFLIPQHEIGYTSEGMQARVHIDALGGSSFDLTVDEVFPSAQLREDQNVFVGQTPIDNSDGRLRPGMRGEATAYGPRRPWIWSWTRSAIERSMWWMGF